MIKNTERFRSYIGADSKNNNLVPNMKHGNRNSRKKVFSSLTDYNSGILFVSNVLKQVS